MYIIIKKVFTKNSFGWICKFPDTAVCAQIVESRFWAPQVVAEAYFGHGSWYPSHTYKFLGTAICARAFFRARHLVPDILCPVPGARDCDWRARRASCGNSPTLLFTRKYTRWKGDRGKMSVRELFRIIIYSNLDVYSV